MYTPFHWYLGKYQQQKSRPVPTREVPLNLATISDKYPSNCTPKNESMHTRKDFLQDTISKQKKWQPTRHSQLFDGLVFECTQLTLNNSQQPQEMKWIHSKVENEGLLNNALRHLNYHVYTHSIAYSNGHVTPTTNIFEAED